MSYGNFIAINNKRYMLYGEPLNSYWDTIKNPPPMCSQTHTPGDKGYYAEWVLKDNKLYLIEFVTENNVFTRCSYSFTDYFGKEKQPYFAEWFSGYLKIFDGKVVRSNNHHFPDRNEYCFRMTFKKGILQNTLMEDD